MLSRTIGMLREFPVTWMMLFACPLLWMLDVAISSELGVSYEDACVLLGGPDDLALWAGEWWRIFTGAMHHGGLIHLLLNLFFLGAIGRVLEQRLGSFQYLMFCLGALAVSGVAQSFRAPAVGLSGMLFAQFGLIWIWRRTDPFWQTQISNEMVLIGFVWFGGCFVVDGLGIVSIGNTAHTAGLIYGCIVGATRFGSPRARLWWPVFLSSHVFLIPCFYVVMHPVWSGRYHWRLGDLAKNSVEKMHHYENAVRCDPNLDGPWRNLALLHQKERDYLQAWQSILKGLHCRPASQESIELAREIARFFVGPQNRAIARAQLDKVFGVQSDAWEEVLFNQIALEELAPLTLPQVKPSGKIVPDPDARIEEPALPELPTILPRRALDEIPRTPSKLPAPDPNAPGGAEEGRAA
ncbi:MAG: Rhomboid family protein [Planctomycetaceae bacterium]|nr:Rhomboid family protein [Planctomycetaceae bacterium]